MHGRFSSTLSNVRSSGKIPVISEIKCISPKEGDLLRGREPVGLARQMVTAGASCISVVTEPTNWGGSMELLAHVAAGVSVPVLRKDFLKSRDDVDATARAGAACFLLTLAKMDWALLQDLHAYAAQAGLETLVEVCDAAELEKALSLPRIDLLGVNNRNITELEKDSGTVQRTVDLLKQVPPGIPVISESAVASPEDVREVISAGALAVLVGTYILQAEDTSFAVRSLMTAIC